jgi:hypothetical protein
VVSSRSDRLKLICISIIFQEKCYTSNYPRKQH